MTTTDILTALSRTLDERTAALGVLDAAYSGRRNLSYLSPESRVRLDGRLDRIAAGLPALVVDSLVERLRITGFRRDGQPDAALWSAWGRCDLDQLSTLAHREALTLGRCPIIVWADRAGRALATVESAHQVVLARDPATRQTTAAMKRWSAGGRTHAVVFEPDRVTRLVAQQEGATTAGFTVVSVLPNPLGVVPVVELENRDRLLGDPVSEMRPAVLGLSDAVSKLVVDMLTGSEFTARPRRFASGVELEEDEQGNAVNPYPETDRMMISESPDTKFGQLPGSDLAGYTEAIGAVMSQLVAVTGLPEHVLGVGSDNPTSADAIRASEAGLTARAAARQATFGRAWEAVGRLLVAVETGADPDALAVAVQWADPATRSSAQEADATVKLVQAGVLPRTWALARLGYSDDEVRQIEAAHRSEAGAAATADVAARAALADRLQTTSGLSQPAALAAAGLFAAAAETRTTPAIPTP